MGSVYRGGANQRLAPTESCLLEDIERGGVGLRRIEVQVVVGQAVHVFHLHPLGRAVEGGSTMPLGGSFCAIGVSFSAVRM